MSMPTAHQQMPPSPGLEAAPTGLLCAWHCHTPNPVWPSKDVGPVEHFRGRGGYAKALSGSAPYCMLRSGRVGVNAQVCVAPVLVVSVPRRQGAGLGSATGGGPQAAVCVGTGKRACAQHALRKDRKHLGYLQQGGGPGAVAEVLDNGDVASQTPVHAAALVTHQHAPADGGPAGVCGAGRDKGQPQPDTAEPLSTALDLHGA